MNKNDNFLSKILIILVVTVLALTAVLYLVQYSLSDKVQADNENEYMHDFTEKILNKDKAICGNGIIEGLEECDSGVLAEDVSLFCPSDDFVNYCNENCKIECLASQDITDDLPGTIIAEGELGYDIVCTWEYDPVCGVVDGEYQTFTNACLAEADGVTEYTMGECKE